MFEKVQAVQDLEKRLTKIRELEKTCTKQLELMKSDNPNRPSAENQLRQLVILDEGLTETLTKIQKELDLP
jgi:hypothetical protein